MKTNKYTLLTLHVFIVTLMMFTLQSCFQDLGQNPPFDYPEQPEKPPIGDDGQMFYMDFEDDYEDYQSLNEANVVGSPGFAEGKVGTAYAGAEDSYLTFGTASLAAPLSSTMTFSFWYKVDAEPDRAGILVIGPKQEGAPADSQNNRTSGIRIFRENASGMQRIKANVGNGSGDAWVDGAEAADIDPANDTWHFIALVLTEENAILYIDGEEVKTSEVSVSWDGCDIMSIASGSPRFNAWGHKSDHSLIDELRIYNKALTANQINDKYQAGK